MNYKFFLLSSPFFINFVVMDTKTLNNLVADRLDRDPEVVASLIKSLSDVIASHLKDGDSIAVPGFGSFEPRIKGERVAIHPSNGKKILVPPKMTMAFKPSTLLKQKVNKQ